MARITEDYISFETAKLLIKKGFDYNSEYESYYTLGGIIVYFADRPQDLNIAPRVTLQMAMKWLREVHNLEIYPYHDNTSIYNSKWWVEIIEYPNSVSEYESGKDEEFDTYEEACEAAIKYCLENLI